MRTKRKWNSRGLERVAKYMVESTKIVVSGWSVCVSWDMWYINKDILMGCVVLYGILSCVCVAADLVALLSH